MAVTERSCPDSATMQRACPKCQNTGWCHAKRTCCLSGALLVPPTPVQPSASSPDSELKPCPFCGAPARMTRFNVSGEETTHIECANDDQCKVLVDIKHINEDVAIEAWNRRASVNPDVAQCACGRPLECPECMSLRTEPQAAPEALEPQSECPECQANGLCARHAHALRRAAEPQTTQIVAWRWRLKGNTDWWTGETVPTAISSNGNWEIEPLGVIQPQAASPSREAIEKALCCPKGCLRDDDCFVTAPGAKVRYTRTKHEREQTEAILALTRPVQG